MKRLIGLTLAALFLLMTSPFALSDSAVATTMRLEATSGSVTVKNASGVGQSVRDGMRLYNGYALATAVESAAYVSLDSSKAVKLGASGKASIKQTGKRLEVSVSAGELFFNVTAPLKTDESLNIRTSTMVTGVRGSFGWVTPYETGLLHGAAVLSGRDPLTGEAFRVSLSSGQMTRRSASGDVAFETRPVTWEDIPTFALQELRSRPELLELVRTDVPAIEIDRAMEGLDERIERERAERQAAQEALDAQYAKDAGNAASKSGSASGGGSGSGSASGGGSGNGSANVRPRTEQLLKKFSVTVLVPEKWRPMYGETYALSFRGPDAQNTLIIPNIVYYAAQHPAWEEKGQTLSVVTEVELADGSVMTPDPGRLNSVGDCYALKDSGFDVTRGGVTQHYSFRYALRPVDWDWSFVDWQSPDMDWESLMDKLSSGEGT